MEDQIKQIEHELADKKENIDSIKPKSIRHDPEQAMDLHDRHKLTRPHDDKLDVIRLAS